MDMEENLVYKEIGRFFLEIVNVHYLNFCFCFFSMDKSAVGHEHIEKVEKHASQKDYTTGFGGKYGIQKDR